jgi:hypothetical protein
MMWSLRRCSLTVSVGFALLLCRAVSAHAGPINLGGTVTVTETETNPTLCSPPICPPTTDLVTVGTNPEISGGDTTNIGGGILFSGEYIDIGTSSIAFKIYGGGSDVGTDYSATNYGTDAAYTFLFASNSLDGPIIGLGLPVIGNVGGLASIINFSAADLSFTADSITVHVGGLDVLDPELFGPSTFGLVSFNVETAPNQTSVPEPSSMSLSLLGLALIAGWSGYRRRCAA